MTDKDEPVKVVAAMSLYKCGMHVSGPDPTANRSHLASDKT